MSSLKAVVYSPGDKDGSNNTPHLFGSEPGRPTKRRLTLISTLIGGFHIASLFSDVVVHFAYDIMKTPGSHSPTSPGKP